SHEQGHRAWYAYSAGCQLSPPGGLGSDHPTLDLINKAAQWRNTQVRRLHLRNNITKENQQ
ncbi:hypothetical protein, partial [Escherichia coli]|uniref:hypothetical protein n=1 Tax=Escherichia coli TaxID=562 RepID=UPI00301C136C